MGKEMKILLIFIVFFLSSCAVQKEADDTEHLWIDDNGIEFYE